MSSMLKLRPVIFGLAIFNLIWMWAETVEWLAISAVAFHYHGSSFFDYDKLFLASFLLLASLGVLLNRRWSQWASLIVSGFFLYSTAIRSFWYLARNAEVPPFSYDHFSLWYPNLYDGQLLHIVLFALIFCCAAVSILKSRHPILNQA